MHFEHNNPITTPIPTHQKAAIVRNHGDSASIENVSVRIPASDEVLVNIFATGVCHTDLHAKQGDWAIKSKLPLIGGHEGAGIVVAKGSSVHNFVVNDRVGIAWLHWACGICEHCLKGHENVCPYQLNSGFTADGTFQSYCVAKASHLIPIPDQLSFEMAAPILCAGVTVYKALKETEAKPGEWIVVVGAGGGLGHLAIQYAKAMGMRVLALDTSPSKRTLCLELGAEAFLDPTQADTTHTIMNITDGGAHGILLLAATPKPFSQAVEYCRRYGTIVCVGLPGRGSEIAGDMFSIVMKRITVRGSIVGTRQDVKEALDMAARGLVKCEIQKRGLEELNQVYEEMIEGKIAGRVVIMMSE